MSYESGKDDFLFTELKTQNLKLKTKIVLVVEYDGKNYCGSQYQVNVPTVQDEIEKAIFKLTGEQTRIISACRTDSGVHALGQVVSFRTASALIPETFIKGLNYYLPQDIAVKASYKVNERFSIQRNASSRRYRYLILNSPTRNPLKRDYTFWVKSKLDLRLMNQASQLLLGEHDLASFVTAFSQSVIRSTFRKIFNARVEKKKDLIIFEIVAKSFLPHQVRNTVGTLIRVGQGKITVDDFRKIMETKKPGLAGPTVPAHGLYLIGVNYPRPLGDYLDENL